MAAASKPGSTGSTLDLITCSICLDDLHNPRSLPCLHTFCFKCINDCCEKVKQKHLEQKQPIPDIVEFDCPLCRKRIRLPDCGVEGFPHSFVHDELVRSKNVTDTKRSTDADLCEVCTAECGDKNEQVPPAEVFCRDCRQKLCARCAAPHRQWRGQAHSIIPLSAAVDVELVQLRRMACERDPEEQVKMYCVDCQKNICVVCYATEHNGHRCRKIDDAAAEFRNDIANDIKAVKVAVDSYLLRKEQTRVERDRFTDEILNAEQQISQLGADIKRLVDERIEALVSKLTMAKEAVGKKFTSRFDRFDLALTALHSFETYADHLITNGRSWDITQNKQQLFERATELTLRPELTREDEFRAPRVVLTPMVFEEFRKRVNDMDNFVAHVDFIDYSPEPKQLCELPESDSVWGVASIDDQVYVLRDRVTDHIEIFEYVKPDVSNADFGSTSAVAPNVGHAVASMERIRKVSQMTVPGLRGLADMTSCKLNRCLFVVNFLDRCIHRICVNKGSTSSSVTPVFSKWPVDDNPWGVSASPVTGHVLVTCDEVRTLKEYTAEGKLVRQVELHRDILNPCHAIRLVTSNTIDDNLSAAAAGRGDTDSSGVYVVCHGAEVDLVHRVCLVEANGRTRLAYGGPPSLEQPPVASGDVDGASINSEPTMQRKLIHGPRHMAADSNGFVFVADFNNGRVVLLNRSLKHVADVVLSQATLTARNSIAAQPSLAAMDCFKPGVLRWNPWRLHLDEGRRRLYVVENELGNGRLTSGRVVVFQL